MSSWSVMSANCWYFVAQTIYFQVVKRLNYIAKLGIDVSCIGECKHFVNDIVN